MREKEQKATKRKRDEREKLKENGRDRKTKIQS
jgi:hypothetical protein